MHKVVPSSHNKRGRAKKIGYLTCCEKGGSGNETNPVSAEEQVELEL